MFNVMPLYVHASEIQAHFLIFLLALLTLYRMSPVIT